MRHRFFELAFTDSVRAEQARHGSREAYARTLKPGDPVIFDTLSEEEIAFIEARDSFYMASVSESGWPYVQHRGGPSGFVRHLDDRSFGWLEFSGNRQYISSGNLLVNQRVALIFVDYTQRRRLKVLGRAVQNDLGDRPDLALRFGVDGYQARIEAAMVVTVEAIDWNCPQHITPRFTVEELDDVVLPLQDRITKLEDLARNCAPLKFEG